MAECSICYDNINATTGITTLSCSHSFHFSCIAKWFTKQETCPCCRKEMGDTEVLPENSPDAASDDSDDSDGSSESDESVEEAEFTREDLDAFLRRYGGSLSEATAQAVCSEYAGFTYMELRMLVLGNTGHDLTEEEWNELIEDDEEDTDSDAEGTDAEEGEAEEAEGEEREEAEGEDAEGEEREEAEGEEREEAEGEEAGDDDAIEIINERRVIHYIEEMIGPLSQEVCFDILIGKSNEFITASGLRVDVKFDTVRRSQIKEAAVKIQATWRKYKETREEAMIIVGFMNSM